MKFSKKAVLFLSIICSSKSFASSDLQECFSHLKAKAELAGVSNQTFVMATNEFEPDLSVLKKLDYQPEFKTPIWDYITSLVDENRIDDGLLMLQQHKNILEKVRQSYGVDPYTVVAVWGVESNYGKNFGKYSLIKSLGTLSCYGRRQNYFRSEFLSTLKILQKGDIKSEDLKGSWAGAFGHTQFMPSTFEKIAVDFDKDGRRDLINSIPDALASTANFLHEANWDDSIGWGYEVKLPSDFNPNGESRRKKRDVKEWISRGVRLAGGKPLPQNMEKTGLIMPAGINGPTFLVNKNFDSIYRYNAAESYALAIVHLSDRLRGKSSFITPWPTDDLGLNRLERIELQNILLAKGYKIGEIDGVLGEASRIAIKEEQAKLGYEITGRAGQKLLSQLKIKINQP
jgi:lytic murein transglycosylase